MDLLVKNGTLVTATDIFRGDIEVSGGKIARIGQDLAVHDGARVIDASGKYVFPGMIDGHVHLALPFGGTISGDDFSGGTRAAAFGGVTTVVDFAIQAKGESLAETVRKRRAEADGKVCIDYGLHACITDLNSDVLEEIPQVIAAGLPTFKVFMTYHGWAMDDGALFSIMEKAAPHGGTIGVHAENYRLIDYLVNKLLAEGKTEPKYHAESRPDYCEGEATGRAVRWAEHTGSRLYIFHLTSKSALDEVTAGRDRGVLVNAETCPQYLLLTKERYLEPDFGGAKYVMSPPLRTVADNAALWNGLRRGDLEVVGSDHCPFSLKQKDLGRESFAKIPNGAPGVETTLPLLYTEGVQAGRISLNRLVQVFSTNPARLFGLTSKGTLAVGYDADLVIFDPNKEVTLSAKTLHMGTDYNPYEGKKVKGYPVVTVSRGTVVCENGEFKGSFDHGRFVAREAIA